MRKAFSEHESLADALPRTPVKYRCSAKGCPMPGTIFMMPGVEEGQCGYHYMAIPRDWPKVTDRLKDWLCVVDAIKACRRAHTDMQTACSPDALDKMLAEAWGTLKPLASDWIEQIQPAAGESYHRWGQRLEYFLDARIRNKPQ